ncbi:TOMM precursor leader peptide-binding protein [Kitasatospora sp. NPDC001527]|uniref:TOMM precursor leader peptide-binding protein n=1 Tax=Kitasatospora sp. NPDC001527 TaxID=3154519 RepID=UPI0033272341
MTRGGVRLAEDAIVRGTDRGLVIGDDLGTHLLGDRDLGRFAAGLLPLLDGTRRRDEIARSAGGGLAAHATQFLELLDARGLLHEGAPQGPTGSGGPRPPFLPGAAPDAERRLAAATVTLYGRGPWGSEAVRHLARAGAGRIVLADEEDTDEDGGEDGHGEEDGGGEGGNQRARPVDPAHRDHRPRERAELQRLLTAEAPHCEVRSIPVDRLGSQLAGVPPTPGLLLIALRSSDVRRHLGIARLAGATATPQLYATLKGPERIVGPLVVPDASACWNCCRLRETACSAVPWAERTVQAARAGRVLPSAVAADTDPRSAALGAELALVALRFLTAPDTAPAGVLRVHNSLTGGTREHRVLRMPRCEVCGTPPRAAAPATTRPRTHARTLTRRTAPMTVHELREHLVDPRVGVVRRAGTLRSDVCPTLVRAYAVLGCYTEDADLRDGQVTSPGANEWCGGRAFTEDEALTGALGEAVERYCAAVPPAAARTARAGELDGEVLDPRRLGLYSPRQYASPGFPYRPYDPRTPYTWVRGAWLDGTGEVWLPADQTHYLAGGGVLAQVTTNGLAAGRGHADAAHRATLELVERDALLRAWFTRTPPPALDLGPGSQGAGGQVARLVQDLGAHGLNVRFHLLPAAGGVPVVLCVGLGDGRRWPAVTVTSAAHPSGRTAVVKAALEQAQTVLALRAELEAGRRPPTRDAEVVTFVDHALRYARPGARRRLSFLTAGTDVVDLRNLPDPPPAEQTTARLAARLGTPVAIADVTSADLTATGLRVARALAPGLQPLHCGAGLERLADARRRYGARAPHTAPHPMC